MRSFVRVFEAPCANAVDDAVEKKDIDHQKN